MKKKIVIVSLLAGVMLAACSGGDGGSNVSSLRKSEPAQKQMQAPAPTPQVQVKEVERVVTQMATVIVRDVQQVEVTRQVVQYVEVTPQPEIQGFVDAGVCDPYQPQPTVALDQQDIETGVVQRGQWCMDSFNKAVRP